jgi:phenylpropionate dioxygenase-like ring-hydroxylating dioxygenase large terminal subunit
MNDTPTVRRHHSSQPQSYAEVLDADTHDVPPMLRKLGDQNVGPLSIPTAWYLDQAIHDLEVEKIWKKSWQVACREEDLLDVGDTWVYDIASISIVLVKASKTEIKAFYNACLHRGVALRKCNGHVSVLQCPFHGFTWSLNGTLKMIPSPENFPHINRKDYSLPEVYVGRWGGFVFVNLDPDCLPLETYIGDFPQHFSNMPWETRAKTAHVQKILPCNWKAAQEAFMEAWHVMTTHPQMAINSGERCSHQDAWDNYSRGILPNCTTSDMIGTTPSPQKVYEIQMGRFDDSPPLPPIPEGMSAREAYVNTSRQMLRPVWGPVVDKVSDSELIDIFYYTLFPNFHPFGGTQSVALLFRPNGNDPNSCIMDLMIITPVDRSKGPVRGAEVHRLKDDEDFSAAPELGFLGMLFSQDISNLQEITRGMRNIQRKAVFFATHLELKIRHFYSKWQKKMGLENPFDKVRA